MSTRPSAFPVTPRVSSEPPESKLSPVTIGTGLGILSALGYTGANIALRDLSDTKGLDWAMLVSGFKAIPCCVIAWSLVLYRRSQGLQSLPRPGKRLPLVAAALMMQFGGNVMFAWALSLIGLVLVVPLTFASLICCSALLGRFVLNEPLGKRVIVSMSLMFLSICCLNIAAEDSLPTHDWQTIVLGIGVALIAGLAYGANSIVIRRFVGTDHSVSSVVVVMSTTGVSVILSLGIVLVGPERLLTITADQWRSIVLAGLCNAVAFFSVCSALRFIPAVRANLLNASQTAMCAVAGVMLFLETLPPLLVAGISLTVCGLVILGLRAPARKTIVQPRLEES